MPSLRPRDHLKTKWLIRYRDRGRDPQYAQDSIWKKECAPEGAEGYTYAEAKDEAEFRGQLYERGRYDPWTQEKPGAAPAVKDLTLKEAVERYIEKKREMGRRGESGGWTKTTAEADGPVLRQFYRDVGPGVLTDRLRPEQLREWVYKERLADVTKRTRWIKLCAMVRWWADRGWISEPPRLPNKPETGRRIKTTITPAQLERICTAYADLRRRQIGANKHTTVYGRDWYADAWRIMIFQGFRRSEMLELRVRNVMLEERMIQVGDQDWTQKGKRQSLIPLVSPAEGALEKYISGREPAERVFSTPPGNTRVSSHFREAVDHAGLQHEDFPDLSPKEAPFEPLTGEVANINLYTLRHSCATHWLRQERRLVWVKELMRHKEIDTTMNYVHLLPTHLREMYQ